MTAADDIEAFAVAQVVLRERQCRDRGWWGRMADCFWPDSTVRLSWYDGDGAGFVAGSRAITEAGLMTVHRMFAPVVHVSGHHAVVEAPAAVATTIKVDGTAGELVSHARLNYRVQKRDDQWRILSLDSIYERVSLAPTVPGEHIAVPPEELARFRPAYALLAWDAWRDGRTVDAGLLGDDRPELVAGFYSRLFAWLNQQRAPT